MINEADANGDSSIDFPEFVAVFMRFLGKRNTVNIDSFNSLFDNQGFLSSEQLSAEMKKLGVEISSNDINKLIEDADIDGNGKIDRDGKLF